MADSDMLIEGEHDSLNKRNGLVDDVTIGKDVLKHTEEGKTQTWGLHNIMANIRRTQITDDPSVLVCMECYKAVEFTRAVFCERCDSGWYCSPGCREIGARRHLRYWCRNDVPMQTIRVGMKQRSELRDNSLPRSPNRANGQRQLAEDRSKLDADAKIISDQIEHTDADPTVVIKALHDGVPVARDVLQAADTLKDITDGTATTVFKKMHQAARGTTRSVFAVACSAVGSLLHFTKQHGQRIADSVVSGIKGIMRKFSAYRHSSDVLELTEFVTMLTSEPFKTLFPDDDVTRRGLIAMPFAALAIAMGGPPALKQSSRKSAAITEIKMLYAEMQTHVINLLNALAAMPATQQTTDFLEKTRKMVTLMSFEYNLPLVVGQLSAVCVRQLAELDAMVFRGNDVNDVDHPTPAVPPVDDVVMPSVAEWYLFCMLNVFPSKELESHEDISGVLKHTKSAFISITSKYQAELENRLHKPSTNVGVRRPDESDNDPIVSRLIWSARSLAVLGVSIILNTAGTVLPMLCIFAVVGGILSKLFPKTYTSGLSTKVTPDALKPETDALARQTKAAYAAAENYARSLKNVELPKMTIEQFKILESAANKSDAFINAVSDIGMPVRIGPHGSENIVDVSQLVNNHVHRQHIISHLSSRSNFVYHRGTPFIQDIRVVDAVSAIEHIDAIEEAAALSATTDPTQAQLSLWQQMGETWRACQTTAGVDAQNERGALMHAIVFGGSLLRSIGSMAMWGVVAYTTNLVVNNVVGMFSYFSFSFINVAIAGFVSVCIEMLVMGTSTVGKLKLIIATIPFIAWAASGYFGITLAPITLPSIITGFVLSIGYAVVVNIYGIFRGPSHGPQNVTLSALAIVLRYLFTARKPGYMTDEEWKEFMESNGGSFIADKRRYSQQHRQPAHNVHLGDSRETEQQDGTDPIPQPAIIPPHTDGGMEIVELPRSQSTSHGGIPDQDQVSGQAQVQDQVQVPGQAQVQDQVQAPDQAQVQDQDQAPGQAQVQDQDQMSDQAPDQAQVQDQAQVPDRNVSPTNPSKHISSAINLDISDYTTGSSHW